MKGVKAHQRYKTSDGMIVPGATTITGLLNKPMLVKWANNLGLQGIDSSKYVDKAARIGTCAHEMIQFYLESQKFVSDQYSPDEISQAENSLIKFYEWEKSVKMIPLLVENQMVSEEYKFGGTIDCYAEVNGARWLVDFKTGKAIYPEMAYQLAAYRQMLIEHDYPVDGCRIIRVGRSEDEGFEDHVFSNREIDKGFHIFNHLLQIYYLQKGK